MRRINKRVQTYRIGRYIIYIMGTRNEWECYIQEKDVGIISLMFGLPREAYSFEDVQNIILSNFPRESEYYHEQYTDND